MTYILNAISLECYAPAGLTSGRLIAEPDEPPVSDMTVAGHDLPGARYLIVTDDGSGYKSSVELASVPPDARKPTVLSVPYELSEDLTHLLGAVLKQSPRKEFALYLEANRIISRPMPGESHPAKPVLIEHASLDALLNAIRRGLVHEEEVHLVRSPG